MSQSFYKIFTHNFCSPIQGGDPVFDGTVPCVLPEVELDTTSRDCASGWNFSDSLDRAFKIAGLWPTGRPSSAFKVEPVGTVIHRGDKFRAAQIKIVREATTKEVEAAIKKISQPFGEFCDAMVQEQLKWRAALARPSRDEGKIKINLQIALQVRGLENWSLKKATSARAARAAWDTWAATSATSARAAWAARDAWDARDARDAWDAWDAWDALIVFFAAKKNWIDKSPELLTIGIRDAYLNGLEIALPIEPGLLGWAD